MRSGKHSLPALRFMSAAASPQSLRGHKTCMHACNVQTFHRSDDTAHVPIASDRSRMPALAEEFTSHTTILTSSTSKIIPGLINSYLASYLCIHQTTGTILQPPQTKRPIDLAAVNSNICSRIGPPSRWSNLCLKHHSNSASSSSECRS